MLIEIIDDNAEQTLLKRLEQGNQANASWSILYFRCAALAQQPQQADMLIITKPLLEDRKATLYFFRDGDIAVTWHGTQKHTYETLEHNIRTSFNLSEASHLLKYFDSLAQGEEVRQLCKNKIKALASNISQKEADNYDLSYNKQAFDFALNSRVYRKKPDILIVEDQPFSLNLLEGLLSRTYKVYSAANAKQAWKLYLEYAPDIVFLDIEMPQIDGHQFATQINSADKEAYIVMVTANNNVQDVRIAKENGAKGFIVKPYNKQKILDSISKFQKKAS